MRVRIGRLLQWAATCLLMCVATAGIQGEELASEDTAWLTPESVCRASGPAYGTTGDEAADDESTYSAKRAIDGNPATFCCLLDDSLQTPLAGAATIPPGGSAPVTGHLLVDLGRVMQVTGVRLVARDSAGLYGPKNVDVLCWSAATREELSAQLEQALDARSPALVTHCAVPPIANGTAHNIEFAATAARFVELKVHDSYESGPIHFNFQLAELRVGVRLTSEDKQWLGKRRQRGRLQDLSEQIEKLRQAIEYLHVTYTDDYPGPALLQELETLRQSLARITEEPWREDSQEFDSVELLLKQFGTRALVTCNPLLRPGKILFVRRHTYRTGWYYAEFMQAGPVGGNLCILDLASGQVTELCPQLSGGIFDRFDLSFDGQRVVFGYRPSAAHALRLYEVQVDGSGLRQLTFDPAGEAERLTTYGLNPGRNELGPWRGHTDDFHPCYLPDGGIVFASSRCERGVLCDAEDNLSVNVLYRIDGDGGNLRRLSENALSESTPSVMQDGRILYTRWEYVYKGVIAVQSLWTMRPDGGGSQEVYGNQHVYPPVLIHGRSVPGSNHLFVATCTMHHPFAVGPILLIDTQRDIRTHAPLTNLTPETDVTYEGSGTFPAGESFVHIRDGKPVRDNSGPLFCDPWPLSDKFFLVTCNPDKPFDDSCAYGLWLIDTFGNRIRIWDQPDISCWQPVPVRPRAVPPIVPPAHDSVAVNSAEPSVTPVARDERATLVMTDVYRGLEGVPRGEIKYLRILEQVPRPWTAKRFWPDDIAYGQNAAISLGAHIFVTVLHGVVPVEEDGSAHFTIPARRSIYFQALDERFMEVERMRTFVNLQPGEVRGCIGCHQPRNESPSVDVPRAALRAPDTPRPQPGDPCVPRPLYYPTDVQPILDRHCVRCHGTGPEASPPVLTGELTTYFNRSYEEILGRKLIAFVQEFIGTDPEAQKGNVAPLGPRALGSHASRLITVLRDGHYEVRLSEAEWVRLVTWVDANGPYYGSYFGRRNTTYRDLPDFRPLPTLESAWGTRPN